MNTGSIPNCLTFLFITGVIPFEDEEGPSLLSEHQYWCIVGEFELGRQCDPRARSSDVVVIPPRSSPIVELSIEMLVGLYDRAKLTLNIVPVSQIGPTVVNVVVLYKMGKYRANPIAMSLFCITW